MAINICTHRQEANQIERAVCLSSKYTIEDILEQAYQKLDENHKVIKVLSESGEVLCFWRNDRCLDSELKQCECMMQYDIVDIPIDIFNKKYICFPKVDECTVKFAVMLEKKTDIIPLFRTEDILTYKLPYESCSNVREQENILYLREDDFLVFNSIGIYNEQRILLERVQELRNQGIRILLINIPTINDISRPLTVDEKIRITNQIRGFSFPQKQGDEIENQLKKVYGEENYNLYREGKIANIQQYYKGNECVLQDREGEYSNVAGGLRMTTNAPLTYKNSLYFMGPCIVGGMFCKDSETIPSVIQRMINKRYPDEYLVVNCGTCGFYRSYLEKLDKLLIRRGDMVVIMDCFNDIEKHDKELSAEINVNLVKLYDSVQNDLFFESPVHMGARGNQAVGEYIYPFIEQRCNRGEDRKAIIQRANISPNTCHREMDLKFYFDEAEKLEMEYGLSKKKNGAIVMNCNPFTKGHKYLIDTVRKQVDYLIVFVVEEDGSYYGFNDRKRMVELGTEEYDNVIVLSSGTYVLSNLTMPEYFNKDMLQEVKVNPTKDVEIFARDIAPIFHIIKRFVGEEPIDKVTAQYNRAIQDICPRYNIEVEEIPRAKLVGGG